MNDTAAVQTTGQKIQDRRTQGTIYKMIIAMTFLLAFGLIMIFSATDDSTAVSNLKTQIIAIAMGAAVMFALAFVPYGIYKRLAWPAYILSFVLTLLLKTGLGVNAGGATRWLKVPGVGFQFQVADATKLLMIVFIAAYISSNWRKINSPKAKTSIGAIVTLWILVGFQAGLLLIISTNLSSCIVILGMCFCSTFIASRQWKFHLGILLAAIICAAVYILVLVQHLPTEAELESGSFRAGRIYGWLYTEQYKQSVGYQVIQSLYAIGSGSFLGKGLGNGTQKQSSLISEAQNDMIFAIVCEELGIVGAVLLFLLYGYLLYQMYVIVKESANAFGSMLVIGVMIHIICQVVINVCVATNLFPNTGVTLPFISYGGSAVLMTMTECGICIGVRRQQTKRMYQKYINE